MATGHLTLDLDAVAANWQAMDRMSSFSVQTAAVVKADAYGLGAGQVAARLAAAGARKFFVAVAEEGAAVRNAVGAEAQICVFSGHMEGDTKALQQSGLVPMLNSVEQLTRHLEVLPDHPFGVQLDTGMNRLGMEPAEWAAVREIALAQKPVLVMSHLACADEPSHPANAAQLACFREITQGVRVPRSLAATGGIVLGRDYHFDLTRPGVGLYGGLPFAQARPVVHLDLPVVQIRTLTKGEAVGYGNSWTAPAPATIATVSGGYADGLIRAMGHGAQLFHGRIPCPVVGRVSMDLITVDITRLDTLPDHLTILGEQQGVDTLAEAAGTIGYEILTSLGARYRRQYRDTQ